MQDVIAAGDHTNPQTFVKQDRLKGAETYGPNIMMDGSHIEDHPFPFDNHEDKGVLLFGKNENAKLQSIYGKLKFNSATPNYTGTDNYTKKDSNVKVK
jgi:hypothetical protein